MPAVEPFFDTNVLLYLLSSNEANAEHTQTLLESGGVISVQVLNEFASVALGKKAVNFREVREILSILRAVCVAKPLDIETHERGLPVAERYQFSIYDSMIIAAALQAECSTLYTEDLSSGERIEQLTITNPFAPGAPRSSCDPEKKRSLTPSHPITQARNLSFTRNRRPVFELVPHQPAKGLRRATAASAWFSLIEPNPGTFAVICPAPTEADNQPGCEISEKCSSAQWPVRSHHAFWVATPSSTPCD
jgi:predicted nucleic acid-binding protein